jgi:uncharacterized protein
VTRRPLVLLPPSKGKAPGGDGAPYRATLDPAHPLTPARRELLDAVLAVAGDLDDAAAARVCGVAARDAPAARASLARVDTAATMPAHRRYTGIVHGNAGLAELDPDVVAAEVRIVSPLLGLAALHDLVPAYRLELAVTLPDGVGGLGPWWRARLAAPLAALGAGRRVWDLLPGEHARVWDPDVRADLDVVTVRFLRPDGRAANAARTKVCKGRLASSLLTAPDLDPQQLAAEVDPGEGWTMHAEDDIVTAVFAG